MMLKWGMRMCRRFTAVAADEVTTVLRELQDDLPISEFDGCAGEVVAAGPDGAQVCPGSCADLIVRQGEQFAVKQLTWGFPVEWSQRPVYNTRLETAMGPNPGMWEDAIEHGRCVVLAASFFESHDTEKARSPKTGRAVKRQYRFANEGGAPLLLAAVNDGEHFSVVTTAPNAAVASVHNRMPLVLQQDEACWWLNASWPDFVAHWQKLMNRSALRITATPEQPELRNKPSNFEQGTLF